MADIEKTRIIMGCVGRDCSSCDCSLSGGKSCSEYYNIVRMAEWKDEQYNDTKKLVLKWLNHIEQLAFDRKTGNGFVMNFQDCLDEIKVIAKDAQEYLKIETDEHNSKKIKI